MRNSVGLSVCRSVGLSVCRSVGLSVCRSVGLSVCRSNRYLWSFCELFCWVIWNTEEFQKRYLPTTFVIDSGIGTYRVDLWYTHSDDDNFKSFIYVSPRMGTISLCVLGVPVCELLAVPARMRTGAPRMHTVIGFDRCA
jgi:hypothetical protein